MASLTEEKTLEETPTWAVAVVCFVLVVISIFIEYIIHLIASWLKKKHKSALYEALEKIKSELMLLGFISLLLTVFQGPISDICIPRSVASTWHPCQSKPASQEASKGRKLLQFSDTRRSLAVAKGYDKCGEKGKVAFVSAYGIHQLHIFIFVLAVFHVLYCIITFVLGRTKMRKWRAWEEETKTIEYQYYNDPERFRFTRDTTFGRRHLHFWSKSPITIWIVCFFRQFLRSVTKVDYMTLRHGFIMAHLAPGSETKFDFQKYICRSLEDDFKHVVEISPLIWFFAVLFLLSNTHGWFSYLWLPFIPLIIILTVGTKLQVIITKMGLRIQDRGDVVKGAPVVQPGDDLFWFGRPRLMLFLIHFVLFQNAFQLAFFAWSTYEFGLRSCFHQKWEDVIIRISMGVIIQFLCSYVTLPLYALVTQMGSTMRPTIFNERVAAALRNWHRNARRHVNHQRSEAATPLSSRPQTPTHGMSPVHLLHNYRSSTAVVDSFHPSPVASSTIDNDNWDEDEGLEIPEAHGSRHPPVSEFAAREPPREVHDRSATELPAAPRPIRTQHEIDVPDFTFGKRGEK